MISAILILKDTASKLIGDLSPDFDDEGSEDNNSKNNNYSLKYRYMDMFINYLKGRIGVPIMRLNRAIL